MIKNPQLARRYARALYDASEGKADLGPIKIDPKTAEALQTPFLTYDALIKLIGFEPASEMIKNLLQLLCRRKRHFLLADIVEMYTVIQEEEQGIKRAQVTSAVSLDRATQDSLFKVITVISKAKSVKIHLTEDTDIIGGIVIRMGDNLIDGSVKSKLETFRHKF